MNPKLLGTEIAPKYVAYGKAEMSRLDRTATFSSPPMAFVVKKAAIGMKNPHKTGTRNRWTQRRSMLNIRAKTTLNAA